MAIEGEQKRERNVSDDWKKARSPIAFGVHKASKRLIIAWEEKLRLTIKIKEAERNKGNRRKENVKSEKEANRKERS